MRTQRDKGAAALWLCYFFGEGVHALAKGTGEFGAFRLAEGDDEQAPGRAECEVVGRGFEAFREGLMGD